MNTFNRQAVALRLEEFEDRTVPSIMSPDLVGSGAGGLPSMLSGTLRSTAPLVRDALALDGVAPQLGSLTSAVSVDTTALTARLNLNAGQGLAQADLGVLGQPLPLALGPVSAVSIATPLARITGDVTDSTIHVTTQTSVPGIPNSIPPIVSVAGTGGTNPAVPIILPLANGPTSGPQAAPPATAVTTSLARPSVASEGLVGAVSRSAATPSEGGMDANFPISPAAAEALAVAEGGTTLLSPDEGGGGYDGGVQQDPVEAGILSDFIPLARLQATAIGMQQMLRQAALSATDFWSMVAAQGWYPWLLSMAAAAVTYQAHGRWSRRRRKLTTALGTSPPLSCP